MGSQALHELGQQPPELHFHLPEPQDWSARMCDEVVLVFLAMVPGASEARGEGAAAWAEKATWAVAVATRQRQTRETAIRGAVPRWRLFAISGA